MNKRWEEKLGIRTALLRLSCGEMWARIQAETKEGTNPGGIQADLVVSVLPDQVLIGKAQGAVVAVPRVAGLAGHQLRLHRPGRSSLQRGHLLLAAVRERAPAQGEGVHDAE